MALTKIYLCFSPAPNARYEAVLEFNMDSKPNAGWDSGERDVPVLKIE